MKEKEKGELINMKELRAENRDSFLRNERRNDWEAGSRKVAGERVEGDGRIKVTFFNFFAERMLKGEEQMGFLFPFKSRIE
jgi:hypothetical protein